MNLDFGSGYNPKKNYKTCDITSNPKLDYYFDPIEYKINCHDDQFKTIRCKNVIHHVKDLNKLFNVYIYYKLYYNNYYQLKRRFFFNREKSKNGLY